MAKEFKTTKDGLELYGTAEVATKLGIPEWRVKNFSEGKVYGLPPSFHVGSGRGSRRLYTDKDVVRLAVAYDLLKCGFTSKTIGLAIQAISDPGLLDSIVQDTKTGKPWALSLVDGNWRALKIAELEQHVHKTLTKIEFRPIFILNIANYWDRGVWRFRE